jgi:iron(III) transport system substrate-binding protein
VRSRQRWIAAGLVTAALAVSTTACGSSGSTASGSGSGATITLYNAQHEETTDALVSAFEKQTGIKVKVRNGDEAEFAQQIEQEGSHSPADVFYTENSPALMELEEKNLLAPVAPATLANVDSKYNPPAGDWVGVSARVSCLVYNTSALPTASVPTSIFDLADPKWKGKLALAPAETDFLPIVTAIAKAKGDAAALSWLQAVKHNAAGHIYPDNETLVADVNRGSATIGVINHYYWFRMRKESDAKMNSAIAYFAPNDPGYLIDVSGAGVLRSSKHQSEAQKLLAFLVSKQGEAVLAKGVSYEYPLGSGAAASPELRPFAQLQPDPLGISDFGDGSGALKLLQEAQLL